MIRVFATVARILTFRASSDELRALDRRHLAFGLLLTWLVGMGRWWEDPRAGLLQDLGIGSILYVFALSLFLWLILWPMTPPHWTYFNVLTFVSLTSPPAILYAIPVRHGLDLQSAQTVRLLFLAIVAGWRVLLLGFYLGRGAGLSGLNRLVATLFPLTVIVFALTALNLEKVVFSFMGGIAKEQRSVNDGAYSILFLLTTLSVFLFVPLFISYAVISTKALTKRFRRQDESTVKTDCV
jgi:hypothetical protein